MMKVFEAWAIDTRSTEGPGLLGRYFFSHDIPPSAEGCVTALFMTRPLARQALKEKFKQYKPSWWSPKVVRVKVTIEVVR